MKSYDLVLITPSVRRLAPYLPMLKYLSGEFSIALFPLEVSANVRKKRGGTRSVFLEICRRLGGEVVSEGEEVAAKIAVIPQYDFGQDLPLLARNVDAARWLLMHSLMEGRTHLDRLSEINIERHLVIDLDLYHYRLEKKPEDRHIPMDEGKLTEVGQPFVTYPIFEDVEMDYLIATPTPLSLPEQKDRLAYLRCLLRLLSAIDSGDKTVIKPHNGDERFDYLVNRYLAAALRLLPSKALNAALESIAERCLRLGRSSGPWRKFWAEVVIAALYNRVHDRAIKMKELTPYHQIGLEAFLPSIRKGVITGLSNTIWHALSARIPVYNCVNKKTVKLDKGRWHYHAMEYLDVPYCEGNTQFDERLFDIVSDRTRDCDLLRVLRTELLKP